MKTFIKLIFTVLTLIFLYLFSSIIVVDSGTILAIQKNKIATLLNIKLNKNDSTNKATILSSGVHFVPQLLYYETPIDLSQKEDIVDIKLSESAVVKIAIVYQIVDADDYLDFINQVTKNTNATQEARTSDQIALNIISLYASNLVKEKASLTNLSTLNEMSELIDSNVYMNGILVSSISILSSDL